jgi:hypothetical protein
MGILADRKDRIRERDRIDLDQVPALVKAPTCGLIQINVAWSRGGMLGGVGAPMSTALSALVIVASIIVVAVIAAEVSDRGNQAVVGEPTPVVAHPVEIHRRAAPRVRTGTVDHAGKPVTIACGTCHATRDPNPENRATADLDQFHQGLQIAHGTNTCLSCHNPGDYDSLRRSDGRRVAFEDSIELCSQCHGPQRRDYDHGAHGGMNGHWDLSRGGRYRNTCIDCHDPHVPKYSGAIPMPHARDRFQGVAHE